MFKSGYCQADETTTPIVDKEKHKASKEYLWMVRTVIERLVLFHYDKGSRAGCIIEGLAKEYNLKGDLQCDGFAGYESAFKTNMDVTLVICMAHIRRKFKYALGRKNNLFYGNHEAAENMCIIILFLSTCRNHGVNPREYLSDIIARMPYMEKAGHDKLVELLPHRWKQHQTQSMRN